MAFSVGVCVCVCRVRWSRGATNPTIRHNFVVCRFSFFFFLVHSLDFVEQLKREIHSVDFPSNNGFFASIRPLYSIHRGPPPVSCPVFFISMVLYAVVVTQSLLSVCVCFCCLIKKRVEYEPKKKPSEDRFVRFCFFIECDLFIFKANVNIQCECEWVASTKQSDDDGRRARTRTKQPNK